MWSRSKSCRRSCRGTRGRREPVDESQSRVSAPRGTETTEREGDTFMSWTEGQEICNRGMRETSNPDTSKEGGIGEGGGRRTRSWNGSSGNVCRWSGEGICYQVFRPKNVDHGACELSQVGEVSLLAGGPWRRNSKQSMSEWFVVSKNCKISSF